MQLMFLSCTTSNSATNCTFKISTCAFNIFTAFAILHKQQMQFNHMVIFDCLSTFTLQLTVEVNYILLPFALTKASMISIL